MWLKLEAGRLETWDQHGAQGTSYFQDSSASPKATS
jgi:hypothetical protein